MTNEQLKLEIERLEECMREEMAEKEMETIEVEKLLRENRRMRKVLRMVQNFWPDRVKVHPDVKILLFQVEQALRKGGETK